MTPDWYADWAASIATVNATPAQPAEPFVPTPTPLPYPHAKNKFLRVVLTAKGRTA